MLWSIISVPNLQNLVKNFVPNSNKHSGLIGATLFYETMSYWTGSSDGVGIVYFVAALAIAYFTTHNYGIYEFEEAQLGYGFFDIRSLPLILRRYFCFVCSVASVLFWSWLYRNAIGSLEGGLAKALWAILFPEVTFQVIVTGLFILLAWTLPSAFIWKYLGKDKSNTPLIGSHSQQPKFVDKMLFTEPRQSLQARYDPTGISCDDDIIDSSNQFSYSAGTSIEEQHFYPRITGEINRHRNFMYFPTSTRTKVNYRNRNALEGGGGYKEPSTTQISTFMKAPIPSKNARPVKATVEIARRIEEKKLIRERQKQERAKEKCLRCKYNV